MVQFLMHVRDDYVPWVESHLWSIALLALLLAVVYVLIRALGRHVHARTKKTRTPRVRRSRSMPTTAAQRNLEVKLRSRVGHEDDAVHFIDWPMNINAPDAVLTIRYAAGQSMIGMQARIIHEIVEQMCGGKWRPDHDHQHNKLRFIRLASPFKMPIRLSYTALDRDPERVTLGVRDDGLPCRWDLTFPEYAHALIVGMTGSGKSNVLRVIIAELAQLGALIDILDAKGGEDFEDFASHPGIRVWTEPPQQVQVLYNFIAEMERRKPTRGAVRERLPRRVLLIDETAELRPALRGFFNGEEYADILLTIARLARAYRMHLICATQKPTAKALTGNATSGGELRDMFGFRLGLGRLSGSAAGMIFDGDSPPVEVITGRGVTQVNGEFTQVQMAKLDLTEAVRVAARGSSRFDLVTKEIDGDPSRARARVRVDPQLQGVTTVTEIDSVTTHLEIAPVTLTCLKCGTSFETVALGGMLVRCKNPACKHPRRVPVNARTS